jgi:hypothetical protein
MTYCESYGKRATRGRRERLFITVAMQGTGTAILPPSNSQAAMISLSQVHYSRFWIYSPVKLVDVYVKL